MKDRVCKEFCHTVGAKSACISGKIYHFVDPINISPSANVLVMDHRGKLLDLSVCNKICEGISIFWLLMFSSVLRPRSIGERLWGWIWVSWRATGCGGWAHYALSLSFTCSSHSMSPHTLSSSPWTIGWKFFPRTSSGGKLVLHDQVDRLPGKPWGWGFSQPSLWTELELRIMIEKRITNLFTSDMLCSWK